jgi:hypothetical protein
MYCRTAARAAVNHSALSALSSRWLTNDNRLSWMNVISFVDLINRSRSDHVITLENEITRGRRMSGTRMSGSGMSIKRRDLLKVSAIGLAGTLAGQGPGAKKTVIVIGAGIAGLSCGYELMRRGHNVTVLEASGRAGGHVRTFHDQFADGLYADIGAEHFYYPGYTDYWRYLKEFSLTAIPYPRRDNMVRFLNGERFTEEDLHHPELYFELAEQMRELNRPEERRDTLEFFLAYREKLGRDLEVVGENEDKRQEILATIERYESAIARLRELVDAEGTK